MKKKIQLLCFCSIIFITSNYSYSSDFFTTRDISTKNIGDTMQIFESQDEKIEGYLYVFADESSCFTCTSSLKYLYSIINKYLKIKGYVFFKSKNIEIANKFREEFSKDYEIILDRIGAYASYYGIKFEPSFILLNKYGKIFIIQKLGSPNFHEENAAEIAKQIQTEYKFSSDRDSVLKKIKTIKLTYNDKPLLSNNSNSFLYDKINHSYYFLIMDKPFLFMCDSNGICTMVSDNQVIKNHKIYQGYSMEWLNIDSIFYILCMAYPSKHIICEYDIQKQKYLFTDKYVPKNTDIHFCVLNNSNFIYSLSFPSDSAWKLSSNDYLAYIVDQNSNSIAFFTPDTI